MNNYKTQVSGVIGVFVLGVALGKSFSKSSESLRDKVFPVEGLKFENVSLTGKAGTREAKIMTISHTTPTGVVRYGRGIDPDQTRDRFRLDGTFCGEKITVFGELLEDPSSQE